MHFGIVFVSEICSTYHYIRTKSFGVVKRTADTLTLHTNTFISAWLDVVIFKDFQLPAELKSESLTALHCEDSLLVPLSQVLQSDVKDSLPCLICKSLYEDVDC